MPIPSPHSGPAQSAAGRTFLIALAVLGVVAALEAGSLAWLAFFGKRAIPPGGRAGASVQTSPGVGSSTGSGGSNTNSGGSGTNPGGPTAALRNPGAAIVSAGNAAREEALVNRLRSEQGNTAAPSPVPAGATGASGASGAAPSNAPAGPAIGVRTTGQGQGQPSAQALSPEAKVTQLIRMARALRERGDNVTAQARLREAQLIYFNYPPIISEMAITYERMGLGDKALEQWKRVFAMGDRAGIYYATAEAKIGLLQARAGSPAAAPAPPGGGIPLIPAELERPVFTLGEVAKIADTGDTEPLRRVKISIPIRARPRVKIEPRDIVIQAFFYEQLKDGTIAVASETGADILSTWQPRMSASGEVLPVDWSSPEPEVLEVEYTQLPPTGRKRRDREKRNYFGYSVQLYYKGILDAKTAEPARLFDQFPPPETLPSSDLPQ